LLIDMADRGAGSDPDVRLDLRVSLICPPVVEFGAGSIARLATWVASIDVRRILVVADAFNAARVDMLGLACEPVVFGQVRAEPETNDLDALLVMARLAKPDLIVGFGGGSAMDLAKLASVMVGTELRLPDIAGLGRAPPRKVQLAQVPTTAGTGSEAGIRALVTDGETRSKVAVESINMLADIAIIDPELTRTVPAHIMAATGVDALAHCVEAFTSKRAHPLIDLYALEGIRLGGRYLARAVQHVDDLEARAAMSAASFYGGLCLGPVNTTAGHALAYPLGTRWGIPHGIANALIFPHTLSFNAPAASGRTAAIAAALGFGNANTQTGLFDAAHQFGVSLGIDMRLSAHGVERGDLPAMADSAITIRRLLDNNPRDISRDDILRIYEAAF